MAFADFVSFGGRELALALLGTVAAGLFIYWKLFRGSHYWRTKKVPCDDPLPIIGNFLALFKGKPIYVVDNEFYKKHGRIFGTYEGPKPVLFVGEPELLRQILVKDFHAFADRRDVQIANEVLTNGVTNLSGEDWHRVRSVITPAFSTGKLRKMVNLILECGESARNNFQKHAESGTPVDCKRVFGGYTLDVIASSAFGTKLNSHEDPDNIFAQKARELFDFKFTWKFVVFLLAPKVLKWLDINVSDNDNMEFFADLSRSIIQRRKQNDEVHDDLLNNLIEAQKNSNEESRDVTSLKNKQFLHQALDEEDEAMHDDDDSSSYFKNYSKNKSISEIELVAQCVIFFMAGYETTSTTLSMVAYYMALNPKYQEKLIEEIDAVWKKYGTIDAEALREMKYSEAVISETLRLAPPSTRLERRALKDYPLGDTGIVIPKNMLIGIPTYGMQRDPEFFPEPEVFNPDRFLPENKDLILPYTYMPFGAGPRNCLGMRLALMEIKLALLQVFKVVTFTTCPETKIPLELNPAAGLFSPRDVTVKVVKRTT